jgi:glucosylceramidase
LGNDSHWESMHYTPEEMGAFVKEDLVPQFMKEGVEAKILVYDQNRGEEMLPWVRTLLTDEELKPNIYGTAVHWYTSTNEWFPESLQETHELAPDKHIIHTEGCIDSEVPHWNDDAWYWKKEATDWGYQWAKEEDKHFHPKYVPTYRYARDIIGCLNNWVEGWVDWNMVLDEKGGPNLAQNWCIAPILVDVEKDEVYITPLYYMLSHFSKYIRPGAKRIGFENTDESLMVTAAKNADGSTIAVVLNMEKVEKAFELYLNEEKVLFTISPEALQTIFIP